MSIQTIPCFRMYVETFRRYSSSIKKIIVLLFLIILNNPASAQLHHRMIVYGNVYTRSKKPLPGARVRMVNAGGATTSLPDGSFRVLRPMGADTIMVSLKGYAAARIPVNQLSPAIVTVYLDRTIFKKAENRFRLPYRGR